jgi:hypothetical protein
MCVYVYVMLGRYRKVENLSMRRYKEKVSEQAC